MLLAVSGLSFTTLVSLVSAGALTFSLTFCVLASSDLASSETFSLLLSIAEASFPVGASTGVELSEFSPSGKSQILVI